MIVKVISEFRDKFHYRTVYTAGCEVAFDDERAKDLIERGLAEPVAPVKVEKAEAETTKVKKK